MSNRGQLQKRDDDDGSIGLTIAKWSLMGIGAVVVVGWVLSAVSWMFPLLVLGGLAWGGWKIFGESEKKSASSGSGQRLLEADPMIAPRADDELAEFDRRLREEESAKR